MDDITLREGELIFIGLLEIKLGSYYQLAVAIISHVLEDRWGGVGEISMKYGLLSYKIVTFHCHKNSQNIIIIAPNIQTAGEHQAW